VSRYLDSSVSPNPIGVPAGSPGTVQATQSTDLYILGPDQVLSLLNIAGKVHPFALADNNHLSVNSMVIVAELYGDSAATEFIADLVVAVAPMGGALFGQSGAGVRSDQRGREPVVVIDSSFVPVGNNVNIHAKTVQAVLFILQAQLTNSDAVTLHQAQIELVALIQIDQLPTVGK
jgi:hypothetical protein